MACELCYCCRRPLDNDVVTFTQGGTLSWCNHRVHRSCLRGGTICPCSIILIPSLRIRYPHDEDQPSFRWDGLWDGVWRD